MLKLKHLCVVCAIACFQVCDGNCDGTLVIEALNIMSINTKALTIQKLNVSYHYSLIM